MNFEVRGRRHFVTSEGKMFAVTHGSRGVTFEFIDGHNMMTFTVSKLDEADRFVAFVTAQRDELKKRISENRDGSFASTEGKG